MDNNPNLSDELRRLLAGIGSQSPQNDETYITILNILKTQASLNAVILEKLCSMELDISKILVKLDAMEKSIKDDRNEMIQTMKGMENSKNEGGDRTKQQYMEDHKDGFVAVNNHQETASLERRFIIRHVFLDVSKMVEGEDYLSDTEDRYGVGWFLSTERKHNCLFTFLHCKGTGNEKWSIGTNYELKVVHPSGKTFSKKKEHCFETAQGCGLGLINWNEMMDYVMNDQLIVEIDVKINGMNGIYGDPLRSFDVSDSSKFTLTVNYKEFHVDKKILTLNSPFFNSLISPTQTEYKLSGVDSETFQKYLEALHSYPSINRTTVEGILFVATKYSTPSVTRKCEDFLLESWAIPAKSKQQMAIKYNLQRLKEQCALLIN